MSYFPHWPGHGLPAFELQRQLQMARNYHRLTLKFKSLDSPQMADYCRNCRSEAMALAREVKRGL